MPPSVKRCDRQRQATAVGRSPLSWNPALGALVAGCGALLGCGAHADDEIPEALLDAIRARDSSGETYPEGPYGSQVGETAPNLCFRAWRAPKSQDFAPDRMTQVCFADFWDPQETTHRLLLVNSAAIWCGSCQLEYRGQGDRPSLAEEVDARADGGLRILGTLFQDSSRKPASEEDAVNWTKAFDVDFPFALDDNFEMGAFADPLVQPFNMLLDTRNMQVVLRLQGDEPSTLWPAVDAILGDASE